MTEQLAPQIPVQNTPVSNSTLSSPQPQTPPNTYQPVQPPNLYKRQGPSLRQIMIFVIILVICILLYLSVQMVKFITSTVAKQVQPLIVAPTTPPTPIPTKGRPVSDVTKDPSFGSTVTSIESLWTTLQNTSLQDSKIIPPSVELPLGFSK